MDVPAKRILLVEDNEDDYLILRELLSDLSAEDWHIDWVQSIGEARKALTINRFDVCLVDHRLGGDSGLTLIEEQVVGGPPIILLTGQEDYTIDLAATKAGAMDYLVKGQISAQLLERSMRYAMERARREAKLQETQHQSRLLIAAVNSLTDGMLVTDAKQNDNPIIFANPTFSAMTGYASEEVLGRNCRFLQGAQTDQQMVRALREAIQQARPYSGVILNYRKDGTPFWNGIKITPVLDQEGVLTNFVGLQADVTARRQTEIALQESQANLAQAHRIIGLGVWEMDLINLEDISSNPLRWSDETYRLFGYEPGQVEVDNELFFAAVHPDDRERVGVAMMQALKGKEPYNLEHRILWPNGTEHILQAQADLVFDEESGLPLKVVGTGQDITERKQGEAALAQLAAIVRSSSDAIMSKSLEGIITSWNAAAEKIYGYSAQEIVGQHVNILVPSDRAHEEDDLMRRHSHGENVPNLETTRLHKSGETIAISLTSSVLADASGNIFGASQISRDITERKQAEASKARLAAVVEYSNDAIISKTLEGVITTWNRGAEQIYGYSAQQAVGKHMNMLLPPDRPQEENFILEKLRRGESIEQFETQRRRKDGVVIDVSLSSSPLLDAKGAIIGASSIARNITERKQAEANLKGYAAKLENSNRELQDFAYVASHDLQEPLRKIQAFSERIQAEFNETLGADGRDYVDRMHNAAQRMQNLIKDLLEFSRVTTQAQPFAPVNLQKITQEVLVDLETRIQQTGAQIQVGDLPTIEADPLQIRQLLQNLVSNAIKFQPKDAVPVVKVQAYLTDVQEDMSGMAARIESLCHIIVQDNGIGFEQKHVERILAPFQRLHGRNQFEGTGIGLAICRRIAERHGGHLTAKSAPGQGATFILTLPANQGVEN